MPMTYSHPDHIVGMYDDEDAVWFFNYEGDPHEPHALLTGGDCSDGYINSALVTCIPANVTYIVSQLVPHLPRADWVVGSPYAAITFSYEVARQLGARHGHTEKDPQNPKRMRWQRFAIPEGATVLQAEELVVTFGTTMEVRRAIQEENPASVRFLPLVATAIYRPPDLATPTPLEVYALVRREVKTWKREACPLHAHGSEALRPKEHWAELKKK